MAIVVCHFVVWLDILRYTCTILRSSNPDKYVVKYTNWVEYFNEVEDWYRMVLTSRNRSLMIEIKSDDLHPRMINDDIGAF
jgi:hypothetical protein